MATINDLVLVHVDNRPGFFARIEDISPDVKPGWWQVSLLVLTVPLQVYTWILDDSQVDGAPFTMGGTPMMIEKVVAPPVRTRPQGHPSAEEPKPAATETQPSASASQKVVFLSEHKKKG
ncbi:hypothetical protein OR1_01801 [Geobacter sp. OR-1]|uniref:hypothetical protein n=1 Tax=Geobacter sp. OR-1 TaxID=1266765 RepID=UPI0005428F80|nr:hypothetical protein [Geobacter sp. OR-1]GAM09522.1 hypothetical protein OR1_01801 [Geobacter sp. OR-1]